MISKWLAIFLLMFVPLQSAWALVGVYCQYENGMMVKHFWHHDHQHKANDGQDLYDTFTLDGTHLNSSICYPGYISIRSNSVKFYLTQTLSLSLGFVDYQLPSISSSFGRIERPQ